MNRKISDEGSNEVRGLSRIVLILPPSQGNLDDYTLHKKGIVFDEIKSNFYTTSF